MTKSTNQTAPTERTQLQRLDDRQDWRQKQWNRRNRNAAWLIEEARQQAKNTGTAFIKPMRPARCGWPIGRPTIQLVNGKASIRNLEHCASPWCCPICATIIRAKRAKDLQKAIQMWMEQSHGLAFITLTRPHTKTERLDTGIDTVMGAWSSLIASQRWRTVKASLGIEHWCRSTEVTWNPRSGWHVHIHVLAFTLKPHPDCEAIKQELFGLWNAELERRGTRPASKKHGIIVLPVETTPGRISSYINKAPDRIGSELTRMDNKRGRKNSIAPFQLLDQPVIDRLGENRARRLWLEYVHTTSGQHSMSLSRKLRIELIGGEEQTDRQIIDDTNGGDEILDIPAAAYRQLKREPSVMAFIMSRVETGEIPLAIDIINDVK
ncbi:protein rep [Bifidobacterium breve]|uniref:protein rep n=1 Tax=Bifidobacterium breve TaxID=1685 RepID=UPI002B8FC400|nr:protein rep [Bifidobacterium breve]MEB3517743.1 protein rep [Bifidobacterium breve]